jgi:hypothetical protein
MISAAQLTSKLVPLAYPRADLAGFPSGLSEDDRGGGRYHGEEAGAEHGDFGR